MVQENHNEMLQGSGNNSHSTDKKTSNIVYQIPWMKLKSPVAESLREVFFGSKVMVRPEIMTAVKGENSVGDQEVNKSNGTQTVDYSVKVDVFSTAVTPPQQGNKSGDAEVAEATSGVTPEAVPPSTIVIAGTPGAEKYIKVLRAYRIVLLGKNGDGKSSLGNCILGEDVFKLCGTNKCQIQSKSVHERRITLVDTPGFSETDQPEEHLKDEIVRCTTECAIGPHAFLIVLKVEESTEKQKAVIDKIKQYFSEEFFQYAAVVFTHGDQLHEGVNIEQYVSQNTRLHDLVKKCSGRYHVVNNKCKLESDDNKFQMSQILNTVDKIVMENKGGCYINQMTEVQKREKSKTVAGKQPQNENDKGNNGPHKNMWVSLSGPAGMSVAKAFFGPTVTVWQKTTRVAVNDENKLTDEEEVNEDIEATTESEPEEASKTKEDTPNQENEKHPEKQSTKQNNEKQGDKTGHEQNSFFSLLMSWGAAALATLAVGVAGAAGALAAGAAGAAGALAAGAAGALAALAAGALAALAAGAAGALAAIVALAVMIGVWIKNLYKSMKENLGLILLVVAFFLLLVSTFFARVPMAGTLLLSGGIVVLFLLIMLLVAFMK